MRRSSEGAAANSPCGGHRKIDVDGSRSRRGIEVESLVAREIDSDTSRRCGKPPLVGELALDDQAAACCRRLQSPADPSEPNRAGARGHIDLTSPDLFDVDATAGGFGRNRATDFCPSERELIF